MKPVKFTNHKIAFRYKGASIFASGSLAKVIAYSFAGMLLPIGIAAIQNTNVSK